MEVIEYIKQTMKEEGVTQMELGRRTGLTRQSVFDVLTRANPNFNTVRRIFNALDRDIDIRKKMEVSWILIKTHCTLFLNGKHLDSEN